MIKQGSTSSLARYPEASKNEVGLHLLASGLVENSKEPK